MMNWRERCSEYITWGEITVLNGPENAGLRNFILGNHEPLEGLCSEVKDQVTVVVRFLMRPEAERSATYEAGIEIQASELEQGNGDGERNKCETSLKRGDSTIWQLIRNKVDRKSQRPH